MSSSPKILFILVNYFNEEQTAKFIRNELLKQSDINFEIILVNNGSQNVSALNQLKSIQCTVLTAEKNLGYFGAANFGLKEYLKGKQMPDAVIVSNTDIAFCEKDFVEILKKKISKDDFDVLGTDITSSFLGQKQNPFMPERISKAKLSILYWLTSSHIMYNLFLLAYFMKIIINKFIKSMKPTLETSKQVYGVHGSFIVFHKNYFKSGCGFEYPPFLFGEEIFVAELCRLNNLRVIFAPSLKILHHEHSTTRIFKSNTLVRYIHQSYSYLLNRFFCNP